MDASDARELFDANARTYDRVNSVISFGLDSRWRAWAASRAVTFPGARVLDAFAGTGGVGLKVAELGGEVTLADTSAEMLQVASRRARDRGLSATTVVTDLTADPIRVAGAPFDAATAMWGLRYLDDPVRVTRNLAEQLTDTGRLVVVDFVEPEPGVLASAAAFYFFHVLPTLANLLARRGDLYAQLVQTTHRMGPAERLVDIVQEAGLDIIETHTMGFGLVLGIVARRFAD